MLQRSRQDRRLLCAPFPLMQTSSGSRSTVSVRHKFAACISFHSDLFLTTTYLTLTTSQQHILPAYHSHITVQSIIFRPLSGLEQGIMPTQTMAGQRFAMILVNITLIEGLVCLIASLSHLLLSSGNHGVSTKISERSTGINETARLDFFEAHSDSLRLTGIAKRALIARDDTDSEEDSESSQDEKLPDAPPATPAGQGKDTKSSSDVKMSNAPQATPTGPGNAPSSNAPNPSGQPGWANPFGPSRGNAPSALGLPYGQQLAPPGSISAGHQQGSYLSMGTPQQIPDHSFPGDPGPSFDDGYTGPRLPSELGLTGHQIPPYGYNDPRLQAVAPNLQSIAASARPLVYNPQPFMVGYPSWCPADPMHQGAPTGAQPMPAYPPPQGRGVPHMASGAPPGTQPMPAYPPPQGRGVPHMASGAPPGAQPMPAHPPPQAQIIPPTVVGAPPQAVAIGQNVPASPPASWVQLVFLTWKTYIPLMYADIQAANQAMTDLKRRNAPPGGWQKDNLMWYHTVELMRNNPHKSYKWRQVLWVQSQPPGVSLRPVEAALSRLRLPNTNQQIHVQSSLASPKILWQQQHQWTLRVSPQQFVS